MTTRNLLIASIVLGVSTAAAAPNASVKAVADARHADRTVTPEAAMRLARMNVLRDLKLHGNFSDKLGKPKVTSVFLSEGNDGKSMKPITGYGTIRVTVKQEARTGLQRLFHPFSKYANREFDVDVDAQGQAHVLNKGWSQTLPAKLGRALRSGPGRLISSIKQNPNAKKIGTGIVIAGVAGGIGLATGGAAPLIALGTFKLAVANVFGGTALIAATKTVGIYQEGNAAVKQQLDARGKALDATITWARAQAGKDGKFPTLADAYEHYNAQHPDQSVVRNYTLGGFAEALQTRGL